MFTRGSSVSSNNDEIEQNCVNNFDSPDIMKNDYNTAADSGVTAENLLISNFGKFLE